MPKAKTEPAIEEVKLVDDPMAEVLAQRKKLAKYTRLATSEADKSNDDLKAMLAVPITLEANGQQFRAMRLPLPIIVDDWEKIRARIDDTWFALIVAEIPVDELTKAGRRIMEAQGETPTDSEIDDPFMQEQFLDTYTRLPITQPMDTIVPVAELLDLAIKPYNPELKGDYDSIAGALLANMDMETMLSWFRDVLRASCILPKNRASRA